jgi:hypothetical protein
MGKKEKEHRKKITKRNEAIKMQQRKIKKAQEEFLMQLIEREKNAGKFNNPVENAPIPDVDLGEGLQL